MFLATVPVSSGADSFPRGTSKRWGSGYTSNQEFRDLNVCVLSLQSPSSDRSHPAPGVILPAQHRAALPACFPPAQPGVLGYSKPVPRVLGGNMPS